MGRTPRYGSSGTPSRSGYDSMVPMRTRLTITKTTTALATSALLVLGLAACGGSGSDEETTTEETATSEESAPTEEETTEETTEEEPAEDTEAASGDFCGAYDTLMSAQSELSSVDPSDPSAAVTAFEDLTSTLEAAEAPAEISADWDNVAGAFRTITDTLTAAVEDPASADMSAMTSILGDESFQTSTQNVATYATQNC